MSQPYTQVVEPLGESEPAGEPLERFDGAEDAQRGQRRSGEAPTSPPRETAVAHGPASADGVVQKLKGVDWRARAPRWTAAVLAGMAVAELAQVTWVLRSIASEPVPDVGPLKARPRAFHWWRLADAHLFGVAVKPPPGTDPAHPAPAHTIKWAMTATVAMSDPSKGIAILGELGKPLHVYTSGAHLLEVPDGRLVQVFQDHVVLDVAGHPLTLKLPQKPVNRPVRMAAVPREPPAPWGEDEERGPEEFGVQRVPPTRARILFISLRAQPAVVDGRMVGVTVHPPRPLQRRYGLSDGDLVTAVNGVGITDPSSLQSALEAQGDAVTLTYMHEGMEQTVNMRMNR